MPDQITRTPTFLMPWPNAQANDAGRIGWTDDQGNVCAGFAQIDPDKLWASTLAYRATAAEVCRRWNAHKDLLYALKLARPHVLRKANKNPTEPGRQQRVIEAKRELAVIDAAIAKAKGDA